MAMILALVVGLFLLSVSSKLSQDGVSRFGGYQMMEVLSGSMSPVFEAGDVIVIKPVPTAQIKNGDIITFRSSTNSKMIITHRVVDIASENGLVIQTKGDANNAADQFKVESGDVLGRYTLRIPYLGWGIEFAKTTKGMLSLVIVPGILILISEFRKLTKTIAENGIKNNAKKREAVAKSSSGE